MFLDVYFSFVIDKFLDIWYNRFAQNKTDEEVNK